MRSLGPENEGIPQAGTRSTAIPLTAGTETATVMEVEMEMEMEMVAGMEMAMATATATTPSTSTWEAQLIYQATWDAKKLISCS